LQNHSESAAAVLAQLKGQEVLIIGDVMLDRYLTGSVSRISPEAPVPVVLHQATEDRLGGAANVALNIKALGSQPILCTVAGTDREGQALIDQILPQYAIETAGIVLSNTRCTTIKTRVLGNNQQMLRIDREDVHGLSADETAQLLDRVRLLLDTRPIRVIIFQDYNKGVLSVEVIETVIAWAKTRGIPTAVDPKKANFFAFKGVDLFKPNLKEIRDSAPFAVQAKLESLEQAANFLRASLQNRYTMITLSEKGLYLDNESGAGHIYPTKERNVADVSGAGDTVISIAALGLGAGLELSTLAVLSNLGGGQVCECAGVVPVDPALLKAEFEQHMNQINTI
jgi:rfaE bifunctional protein kinase chain/domain